MADSAHIEWATYFEYPRFPLRVPTLRNGVEVRRHTVVIVGAGPIGMSLALGLANYGVSSLLIEADDTVCIGSRATCYSRRTLEIWEQLGIAGPILAKGLGWTGGRSFYRNTEVFQLRMPHDENQKYPPMLNMQQCVAENFVLDGVLARGDLIEIRWQSQVTGASVRADGATLEVETKQGPYRIEADWVIACDGARSAIRQALGLKFQGTQYEGRYVIADIELKSDYPTERRAWFDPPSNPGSTLLMHKQPDNIWRMDYQLRDDEDPDEAVRPENVIPRVASHLKMIGERDDWKPVWISMYKANALTLERYVHGRAIFAGDAAHLVPIFGVRGLNSGIDDSHNLAWKLAFVIKGWASASLLESYSDERVHAARENLRYARKSTEFMAPPSHAFELMREAVLSLAVKHDWVRSLINPRQTSVIPLTNSPLNTCSDRSAEFAGGPQPGDVLPQCPITFYDAGAAREGFVTDLLGPHFTALYFSRRGEVPPDLAATLDTLASGAVPFRWRNIAQDKPERAAAAHDATGKLSALYAACFGTLYLVRPDGHLLARWRAARAEEIAAALTHAIGQPVHLAGACHD
jgi:3-(3-hydroxy-phenyl)propionate hydroxylase